MFSQNQLEDLFNIVDQKTLIFIANNIGSDFLSDNDRTLLESYGFDLSNLDNTDKYIEQAFKFGMLSDALSDKRAKNMSYSEFTKFLNSNRFIPLNNREKESINSLKNQSLKDIKGLGEKIKGDTQDIIDEKSREERGWYENVIKEEGKKTIENRETVNDMVSRIGNRTGNWNRDFDRISETVLHTAFDEGRASNIERTADEDDPYVYKDVYAGACKHCIRLYTTNGIGSKPKLYRLSELRANGSNVGKKANEWKGILGATHPYCRCTLNYVPEGYEWDSQKRKFVPPKNKENRKVKRTSKLRVRFGNKE